ncbi:Ribosome maturation factor RimM [Burkholderiales bacterium]|nr:MAG: ribosome maturation factor RimM [Burkholderiales bacterium]CAG1007823.1 Ribosome maturation factor RimM [Burkholderiales bacterium]
MGQVLGAFGVAGWVRLRTFTEDADNLLGQASWWLAPHGTPEDDRAAFRAVVVNEARIYAAAVVAKFAGIDDRDAAAALRGSLVAVPRETLPESGEDEYYWADLLHLAVLNRKGEVLGEVAGLIETGAHDVLRVKASDGVERLIPFVAAYVDTVDRDAGRVLVDWELDY